VCSVLLIPFFFLFLYLMLKQAEAMHAHGIHWNGRSPPPFHPDSMPPDKILSGDPEQALEGWLEMEFHDPELD